MGHLYHSLVKNYEDISPVEQCSRPCAVSLYWLVKKGLMDCDNPHHLRQSNPQKNHRPTIIYLLYPLKYPHFFIVKAYVYWILQWLNHPPGEKPILPPHPQ